MSLIDQLLPAYQFSERHSCRVAADPALVFDAVVAYRPDDDRFFRFMIGLRELPMRLLAKADSIPEPFGMDNFTLLARTDEAIVYGLIGRFWRLNYGLTPVAAGRRSRPSAKTAWPSLHSAFRWRTCRRANQARDRNTGALPDRLSRLAFTPYWLLIRPVSGLIRRRILSSVKGKSEGSSSPARSP